MQKIWMQTAMLLAKRSTCSRLQVGCVITSNDLRTVLGNGYNGGAAGQTNDCDMTVPGYCGHLHAENNALVACGSLVKDKVMFVTTLPCEQCAKLTVNSGFKEVYYLNDHEKRGSVEIFERAGIKLIKFHTTKE